MAVKIVYKDVPPGIEKDTTVGATGYNEFSEPNILPIGAETGAVATLEHNGWGLSTIYKTKDTQRFALWSAALSNSEGVFDTPLSITYELATLHTTTGLTVNFSPDANEYANEVVITWYRGGEIIDTHSYYPTSGEFVLNRAIEAFDKVKVEFLGTNHPERRLKIEQMLLGVVRKFENKELEAAQFIHEVDLIADTVPINVMDADIYSLTDAEFIFRKKQPVEAYYNNNLIGVYFIESGERTGESKYSISGHDYIGLLDTDLYPGRLLEEDTPVSDILDAILNGAYEIEVDETLANTTLQGAISSGTKREALQQVALALGACIDTSGGRSIRMFIPSFDNGEEIPAHETYTGGKIVSLDAITEVSVTGYKVYGVRPSDDDEYIEDNGGRFKAETFTATARNPYVVAGMPENKIVIDKCYLISRENAQARADAILDYYLRRKKYSFPHILRNQKTADRVMAHLPWGGIVNGNISKMTIRVSGLTISETEIIAE